MDSNDLAWINDHMVDLKRSDWDQKTSKPEKGWYVFRNKVYLKKTDYDDSAIRPEFVYKWVGYDEDSETDGVRRYMYKMGAQPVSTSDPIWPETLCPNAEGNYVFQDAMLIKIPLEKYVEVSYAERTRNNDGYKIAKRQFDSETKAAGIHLDSDKV